MSTSTHLGLLLARFEELDELPHGRERI